MPHTIRLRGPWQSSIERDDGRLEQARVAAPGDWSSIASLAGARTITLTRRFGRPTGVPDDHGVWLVFGSPVAAGEARLNGGPLCQWSAGEQSPRVRLEARLEERNELQVVLRPPWPAASTMAELPLIDARLEIDEPGEEAE